MSTIEELLQMMEERGLQQQNPKRSEEGPVALICDNCGTEEKFLEVNEGLVCMECAVIRRGGNIGVTCANMSWDRIKNGYRHRMHKYSRWVHFYEYMRMYFAQAVVDVPPEVLSACKEALHNLPLTPANIGVALKLVGLSAKWRKHRYLIANCLGWSPPRFRNGTDYAEMKRLFHFVEVAWRRKRKEFTAPKIRKTFFSYPFLFWKLCGVIGRDECARDVELLKGKPQLAFQESMWSRCVKELGW